MQDGLRRRHPRPGGGGVVSMAYIPIRRAARDCPWCRLPLVFLPWWAGGPVWRCTDLQCSYRDEVATDG